MIYQFLQLARQALIDPREAAETVMALGAPKQALWPLFALMIVLSVILVHIGAQPGAVDGAIGFNPFEMAIVSTTTSIASVFAVWRIGVAFGGRGTFDEALLLTIFLQAILLLGQVIEVLLMTVFPPVGGLFSIALIVLALWLNLNFVAALHGYSSFARAFGVLLLASLVAGAVFFLTLPFLGQEIVGTS